MKGYTSMDSRENRRGERFKYETPVFIYVEFRIGKEPKKDKVYNLKVLDSLRYGLSMVITQKDFNLLRILNKGDKLQGIDL